MLVFRLKVHACMLLMEQFNFNMAFVLMWNWLVFQLELGKDTYC